VIVNDNIVKMWEEETSRLRKHKYKLTNIKKLKNCKILHTNRSKGYAVKKYGGVEVKLHSFLASALNESEWSNFVLATFPWEIVCSPSPHWLRINLWQRLQLLRRLGAVEHPFEGQILYCCSLSSA